MTFWGGSGSGSADSCLWLMDPDPDPGSGSCYFRHWPSRCRQKTNFFTQFFFLIRYFLKLHLHQFSKMKSQKESQNSRNQGFSYYFCMMIEGSGYGSRAGSGSGSIPLTSGSGSWRPKNTWIRWIRIRNTDSNHIEFFLSIMKIRQPIFFLFKDTVRLIWNKQTIHDGRLYQKIHKIVRSAADP